MAKKKTNAKTKLHGYMGWSALSGIGLVHVPWIQVYITKTYLFKYTEILPPKNEKFQIKNSDIFHISAQNIDCGYSLEPPQWGSSNKYPQSIFLGWNKKNNVWPCKLQFYYLKVGI